MIIKTYLLDISNVTIICTKKKPAQTDIIMLFSKSKVLYVLFDWDGTLSDNREIVVSTINQVLKEYGRGTWETVSNLRNPKLSLRDNFVNFFGDDSFKAYERYVQLYKLNTPQTVKSFPYAKETLLQLKELGVELMIMTNKDRRLLDVELPLLYNPDMFSRIVCGHEALRDKPYPEHIFYTLRGLLSPEEINSEIVWMVGDSNQDSDCALSARALPIRINQTLFTENSSSNSIVYFNDFAEFYDFLTES